MDKIFFQLPLISLLVGGWSVVNGILHDIFVLKKYKVYDRELLRLLMDGHILITCGIIQLMGYWIKDKTGIALWTSFTATASLLVYCFMIFPFLKSIVTITINAVYLFLLITFYFS